MVQKCSQEKARPSFSQGERQCLVLCYGQCSMMFWPDFWMGCMVL